MSLSVRTKKIMEVAMCDARAARELALAVDTGGNPQADAIAALGVTSNLSAAVVVATSLSAALPAAASISGSAGTYAIGAEPTGAEVDTAINQASAKVVTALGLKADNDDVETLRTQAQTAFNLKADNVDLETMRTQAEARLDAIEAKIDAVIASLKAALIMAS